MERSNLVLLRKNFERQDFLSSFGGKLSEPRITAFLGYLLSLNHPGLIHLFNISGDVYEVLLEEHIETQRCDIILRTPGHAYIIEAKLYGDNPYAQLVMQGNEFKNKSPQDEVTLIALTDCHFRDDGIHYVEWDELAKSLLAKIPKSGPLSVLSNELLKHLKNQGMISLNQFEIYAREVNDEPHLSFFLKYNFYTCNFQQSAEIGKCNYFAPHFGSKISNISPGVKRGISYIGRIKQIFYYSTLEEFHSALDPHLKSIKMASEFGKFKDKLVVENDVQKNAKKRTLILLEKPRLVFNPPLQKDLLQEGQGWLGKRYFTFEEFFVAAKM